MVLPRGGGETVLVVDDEPALRRLATRVLGKHRYCVHTAADANQALVELERLGEIDLLITDMIMPGPSGVELARRARERFGSTRVLLMSGYNDSHFHSDASPLADAQFLQKPFSADSLLERVRAALDRVSGVAPIAAVVPDDAEEVATRPLRNV
jgi:DNA-binding response OmpR family regulator